jgi:hypothetical protein
MRPVTQERHDQRDHHEIRGGDDALLPILSGLAAGSLRGLGLANDNREGAGVGVGNLWSAVSKSAPFGDRAYSVAPRVRGQINGTSNRGRGRGIRIQTFA